MDVCFKGANLAPVGAALAANGSPFLQNLSLNYKGKGVRFIFRLKQKKGVEPN
jgi:hypothetical protein